MFSDTGSGSCSWCPVCCWNENCNWFNFFTWNLLEFYQNLPRTYTRFLSVLGLPVPRTILTKIRKSHFPFIPKESSGGIRKYDWHAHLLISKPYTHSVHLCGQFYCNFLSVLFSPHLLFLIQVGGLFQQLEFIISSLQIYDVSGILLLMSRTIGFLFSKAYNLYWIDFKLSLLFIAGIVKCIKREEIQEIWDCRLNYDSLLPELGHDISIYAPLRIVLREHQGITSCVSISTPSTFCLGL